jgi:hypothetical protein
MHPVESMRALTLLTLRRWCWHETRDRQDGHEIGRALDKPHSCIRAGCCLAAAFLARCRSQLALTLEVSHNTIYRALFIQARGVLKKELMEHPRSKRRMGARFMPASMDSHGGRSSTPPRFEKEPRRRRTDRFLAVGKAICWPVERTGIHGFSCT